MFLFFFFASTKYFINNYNNIYIHYNILTIACKYLYVYSYMTLLTWVLWCWWLLTIIQIIKFVNVYVWVYEMNRARHSWNKFFFGCFCHFEQFVLAFRRRAWVRMHSVLGRRKSILIFDTIKTVFKYKHKKLPSALIGTEERRISMRKSNYFLVKGTLKKY